MPSVKDFQKKKKASADKSGSGSKSAGRNSSKDSETENDSMQLDSIEEISNSGSRRNRRRPGRDQDAGLEEGARPVSAQENGEEPVQTAFSGILEDSEAEEKMEDVEASISQSATSNKRKAGSEKIDSVEPEYVAYESAEEKVRTWEVPPQGKNQGGQKSGSGSHKIHIEFPYSDLVRDKIPGVFNLAETVAEEWVSNGEFQSLPVGHPLAQAVVGFGLRKAKDVEKKLDEKGVFSMAKIGIELVKSKLKK
jgi:hypothetical protein